MAYKESISIVADSREQKPILFGRYKDVEVTRGCLKQGDYQATLNVCADCLVYLSQHENSILSPDEIKNIIETKRECVLRGKCNN